MKKLYIRYHLQNSWNGVSYFFINLYLSIKFPPGTWYKVKRFSYNGLMVSFENGLAPYKAQFKEWTTDPGVARFICSDGKERLIPYCCIVGFSTFRYPKQEKLKELNLGLFHFGEPSSSD